MVYKLDTLTKLQLFDPTIENILSVIKEDSTSFCIQNIMNWHIESKFPDKNKYAEILKVLLYLNQNGYVKHGAFKTSITIKGHLFLLYRKNGIAFWTLVITLILGILSITVTIILGINNKPTTKIEQQKELQPPIKDSISYHGKSSH